LLIGPDPKNLRTVETPVWLLTILELDVDSIPSETLEDLPVTEVLICALSADSGNQWSERAVTWLDGVGGVPAEVEPALTQFAHGDRGSQHARHAARRLLRQRGPRT